VAKAGGSHRTISRFGPTPTVDMTHACNGVKELHSHANPMRATDMGFVASAHYPYIQKAEHRLLGHDPESTRLRRIFHV